MFSNQHQKSSRTLENQGSRTRRRGISRGLALLLSFVMAISVIPALKGNVYAHADDTVAMVGTGTSADPYQISTYAQLKRFADIVNGKNGETKQEDAWAVLTGDITCDDKSWKPIGHYDSNTDYQYYTGTFDGQNHKIYNLSNADIDEVTSKKYQGLFGCIDKEGEVKNLGLENGSISGADSVGGVAGLNNGNITNCYNTGLVSGRNCVGGVVGYNDGTWKATIKNCYNVGKVKGTGKSIGGVVGINDATNSGTAIIANCFNTGRIIGAGSGTDIGSIGGVAGANCVTLEGSTATITNCFNTGAVFGVEYIGGVVGNNYADAGKAQITNCYDVGPVTGTGSYGIGSVVGYNFGYSGGTAKVAYCYYDSSKSIVSKAVGENVLGTVDHVPVDGLTTARMTGDSVFNSNDTNKMEFYYGTGEENPWLLRANDQFSYNYPMLNGVGFEKITNIPPNRVVGEETVAKKAWAAKTQNPDYGTSAKPYEISTYEDLKEFSDIVNGYNVYTARPDACAVLVNDIVCTDKEWVPIGGAYTGTFDGQFHKIIGLNNSEITDIDSKNRQGLFGFIEYGGAVKNLGLENSYIRGLNDVGGIAGKNFGEITNCYNIGTVCGLQDNIGGLVGDNDAHNVNGTFINYCYCIGNVSGKSNIGGLVGFNYSTTSLEHCYFVGDISAQSNAGGAVGYNVGKIFRCYSAGWTPVGLSDEYGLSSEREVKELTVKQMTGTTATSRDNMFNGKTSPWLVKEDAEYNGKYYWFYPHLAGFVKDASGNQLAAADITADKWPGKAEISVTWSDDTSTSYEYDKSAHSIDAAKVAAKEELEGVTVNGKEVANTDYTASYSKITIDENGNPVWTDNINASDIVNVGKYKTVLDFGAGHKAIEKQYSITEKAVTVTPDDVTKVYGTTDPELTYTASGLIDGDTLSGGLTRTAGEAAGEYAITLGTLSNLNYDITLVSGKKLTIASKVLGKDELVLSSYEYTYDGTAKVPGVKVYDGKNEVDPALYDVEILNNVNAGTATVNVKEKSAANFVGTITFTINKAEATVTADNKQKAYGDADPGLTYTVTGLYGTDTFGADQISVSRKEGTNVGTYEISVSGEAEIGNYTVKYVPGTLTIVKATPKYSVPTGLTAVVGQKLSEVELQAGWAWADPESLVGDKGTNTFKAVYTPEDITNYNVISDVEVSVVVSEPTQNTENGESGNGSGGGETINGGSGTGESENGESGNGGSGSSEAGNGGSGSGSTGTTTNTDTGYSGYSNSGNSGYTGSGSSSSGSGSNGSGTGNTSGSGAGTKDTTDKDNKDTGKDKDNKDNKDKDTKDNDNKDTDTTDAVVTQNEDGSETKVIETQNEDGSKTTNTIVTSVDGHVTDTKVTVEKNGTVVTEEVEKDAAGNILSSTTETSSVDKKKTVTVVTKTENVDGSSNTSTVSTTKKGTVTITGEIVDADKTKTTFEGKYKKNGAGSSTSKTVDADENVISTTTEKTTVKKGITTTIITTENADGSSVESKTVTDKAGKTEFEETILNADETKTVVTGTINADGTGSNTSTTTDKDGNVLSTIEETTTINSKGTVKVTTTTTNVGGTVVTTETSTYVSGKVNVTNTCTDSKGNKTELSEEIKPTKKGNLKAEVKKTDTTVGKKGSKKTTVSGSVTFKNNGKISGTLTYTAANGKTQKIPVKANLKKLGMEDMDVTEIIDYLFQNLIIKK